MTGRLSPIEAARARHPLADVASRTGIWLPATSGTVTVRCPMPSHGHPDRTPSLRLYLDDGTWYCFGCSARAGDVVQWVTQTEGADWRRAIEILDSGRALTNAWAATGTATVGGRAPTASHSEQPDLDRTPPLRVREAVNAAWAHCTTGPRHAQAVAYLTGRHINVTHLEAYTRRKEAGFTPGHGHTITQRLLADGFNVDELVDAGLAHRHPDGQITDFYRQRLVIPIRDHTGRVAGLVGRNVGDPCWPKYKNPPRTVLYDKAINLYQPLPAPLSPHGRVVVVEGTLDALAIATAAVRASAGRDVCPIAASGLWLSERHLDRVLGLASGTLVACFDGDPAGRRATERLASDVGLRGRRVEAVSLPEGQDPASFLTEWADEVSRWLRGRAFPIHPAMAAPFPQSVAVDDVSPSL
jgi:DNA primase